MNTYMCVCFDACFTNQSFVSVQLLLCFKYILLAKMKSIWKQLQLNEISTKMWIQVKWFNIYTFFLSLMVHMCWISYFYLKNAIWIFLAKDNVKIISQIGYLFFLFFFKLGQKITNKNFSNAKQFWNSI